MGKCVLLLHVRVSHEMIFWVANTDAALDALDRLLTGKLSPLRSNGE